VLGRFCPENAEGRGMKSGRGGLVPFY